MRHKLRESEGNGLKALLVGDLIRAVEPLLPKPLLFIVGKKLSELNRVYFHRELPFGQIRSLHAKKNS